MPFQPQHSLLRVEVPALHSIDPSSVENLFGMWSLFSKTSHAMEDGKRLENLSWRLWNRETFCCNAPLPSPSQSPRLHLSEHSDAPASDQGSCSPPLLSSSCDSLSSQEPHSTVHARTVEIPQARPELHRSRRSRGHEKHLTSNDLANIVASIKRTQSLEPLQLSIPTPSPPPDEMKSACSAESDLPDLQLAPSEPAPEEAAPEPTHSSQPTTHCTPTLAPATAPIPLESSASTVHTQDDAASSTACSDSSSNTGMSAHSVIRGFIPGGAPSSYRSQTNLSAQIAPILKTSPKYQAARPKKRGPMFTIGTSSGEDESSFESHMYKSSLSQSLQRGSGESGRKLTSFRDEVAVGRAAGHSPVFETDEEDEEVSESAIEDDDDSSDWEDSEDQSRPSSVNEKEMFQRVDSRPDLTSRRSLLTTLMHEPDRARALANAASRSTPAMRRSRTTTPNGPSLAASPEHSHLMPPPALTSIGRSDAQPILSNASTHPIQVQLALSPRTTRRNMLSTELTESLRKNLLWERQHRSTGNLTALRRRHTSTDVKNLKQLPEAGPFLDSQGNSDLSNEYFNHGLQEYHAKGW